MENINSKNEEATSIPAQMTDANGNLDLDEKMLFEKVPTDGESVGNKSLRMSLKWEKERYWQVRDSLVNKGYISTGMGRGGSVYRIKYITTPPIDQNLKSSEQINYNYERDLYAPFSESLKKWAKELQFSNYFIQDTSSQGSRRTGGTWTRPDLLLVNVETYQYVPNKYLEINTFEVKPSDGWNIEAVFEAAAHSRFASSSYLAIHLVENDAPSQDLQDRIEDECKRFGVGLIVFEDPADYDTYVFRVEPTRKACDPREAEKFIETQVSSSNKNQLSRWLR